MRDQVAMRSGSHRSGSRYGVGLFLRRRHRGCPRKGTDT